MTDKEIIKTEFADYLPFEELQSLKVVKDQALSNVKIRQIIDNNHHKQIDLN